MSVLLEPAAGPGRLVPLAATAAAALAALAAVWWVGARRGPAAGGAASEEEKAQLLRMLDELSRRFFFVCKDFCGVARQVRHKLQAAQNVRISDHKLKDELMKQYKLFEKLEAIQASVAEQFGVESTYIQEMQRVFARDTAVKEASDGFKAMLDDAFNGLMPILPRTKIPQALTMERVLEIQQESWDLAAAKRKQRLTEVKAAGTTLGLQDLGEILLETENKAWEETLEKQKADWDGGPPELFYSTLAVYMRDSDFESECQRLDATRQKNLAGFYKSFKTTM